MSVVLRPTPNILVTSCILLRREPLNDRSHYVPGFFPMRKLIHEVPQDPEQDPRSWRQRNIARPASIGHRKTLLRRMTASLILPETLKAAFALFCCPACAVTRGSIPQGLGAPTPLPAVSASGSCRSVPCKVRMELP